MERVALITGSSKGLGLELARFLARQGYGLIVTARRADQLEQAAVDLHSPPATVRAIAGDVIDARHRRALIAAAQEMGRLDLLVNNASELGPAPMPALADYPLDALERVMTVNFLAPIALAQLALPLLRESHGLIVNISSDAAVGGYPEWGGYGSSKAALDLATRTLAEELEDDGVGAVSVDPGDMQTEMAGMAFGPAGNAERPLPEVTLPFWAWLLGQDPMAVSGGRYEAQAEQWEVAR